MKIDYSELEAVIQKINEYFPDNHGVTLRWTICDRVEELIIAVKTASNAKEAHEMLNKFDDEYWIDNLKSDWCVTVDFV